MRYSIINSSHHARWICNVSVCKFNLEKKFTDTLRKQNCDVVSCPLMVVLWLHSSHCKACVLSEIYLEVKQPCRTQWVMPSDSGPNGCSRMLRKYLRHSFSYSSSKQNIKVHKKKMIYQSPVEISYYKSERVVCSETSRNSQLCGFLHVLPVILRLERLPRIALSCCPVILSASRLWWSLMEETHVLGKLCRAPVVVLMAASFVKQRCILKCL